MSPAIVYSCCFVARHVRLQTRGRAFVYRPVLSRCNKQCLPGSIVSGPSVWFKPKWSNFRHFLFNRAYSTPIISGLVSSKIQNTYGFVRVWNLVCHPKERTRTEDEATHVERSSKHSSLASCLSYFSTLKMEAALSSETSVNFYRTTQPYMQWNPQNQRDFACWKRPWATYWTWRITKDGENYVIRSIRLRMFYSEWFTTSLYKTSIITNSNFL